MLSVIAGRTLILLFCGLFEISLAAALQGNSCSPGTPRVLFGVVSSCSYIFIIFHVVDWIRNLIVSGLGIAFSVLTLHSLQGLL